MSIRNLGEIADDLQAIQTAIVDFFDRWDGMIDDLNAELSGADIDDLQDISEELRAAVGA